MHHPLTLLAGLGAATTLLGACAPAGEMTEDPGPPVYAGAAAIVLDDGLVRVTVHLRGGTGALDIDAYARCAVAQYAVDADLAFARQVRTIVTESDGTKDEGLQAGETGGQAWVGDAVFLVSATRPDGLDVIDAEATVEDCARLEIPTV